MRKSHPKDAVRALGKSAREARSVLAANLKRCRQELGLSQERAAEKVGFSLQYLQRIERQIVNVPLDTLARFAQAYGVAPHELLAPAEQRPYRGT